MKLKQARIVAVIAVLALRLTACGGNPNGPSEGVTLEGTVVGGSFGAASVRGASAAAAVLTVMVEGHPEMVATIGADGSFTLRGLPEGSFRLIFLSDGVPIGQPLSFDEVQPNQALTVKVAIDGSTVTLLEERRNGMGHGDLEIEGRVEQLVVVNPVGDSRFVIDGYTVIARPGQTSIREGNRARQVTEIPINQQVHVKGVWQPGTAGAQEVLAWEIKLQGDVQEPGEPGRTCMISGGTVGSGIQLEGRFASGTAASFTMTVNGNRASGPVSVTASEGQVRCTGPSTTPTVCLARLTGGARIHVSGTLSSCDLTAASVAANEVKIQN
jgi:hypothetical protein